MIFNVQGVAQCEFAGEVFFLISQLPLKVPKRTSYGLSKAQCFFSVAVCGKLQPLHGHLGDASGFRVYQMITTIVTIDHVMGMGIAPAYGTNRLQTKPHAITYHMVVSWNRATPSHHPFLDGIFPNKNQPNFWIPP